MAHSTHSVTAPASLSGRHSARNVWIVIAAIGLPLLSGLVWHRASDNPLWPVFRGSLNLCTTRTLQLAPVSPDGKYQAHLVQSTCAARFTETMLFVTDAADPWSAKEVNPNQAILEAAGMTSLEAVTWSAPSAGGSGPTLQLWFAPDAYPQQVHRLEPRWRDVTVQAANPARLPGAERLD